MSSKSSRERMAFEPRQKKKKAPKQPSTKPAKEPAKGKTVASKQASATAIPAAVSKRMVRRMAFFCGIPTALGMSSFFVFYWVVSNELLDIPSAAVGTTSLGLFGLGILGLSYGIFSTSWDEDRAGGWIGVREFKTNFGRMTAAWREAKEAKKQTKSN